MELYLSSMNNNSLKRQGIGMVIVLAIEYLLGMTSNLFVQFPNSKSEGAMWAYAFKSIPTALHIIVGILLVGGSIMLLIRSIQRKNKLWIRISIIGLITLIMAAMSGSRFIPTQQASYSYIMSIAFIAAFLAYGWGVYQTKNQ